MDRAQLLELLADGPVIASVKDEAGLSAAMKSDVGVIFLLFGDVLYIGDMVARAHAAGKVVFVHLDLVDGLAAREVSVDFIARHTAADGVLSTKASLTRRAKELGLVAIQRFFLLDSMAIENISRHLGPETSDLIEVLPGIMGSSPTRRTSPGPWGPGRWRCPPPTRRYGPCEAARKDIHPKTAYPFQRKGEWNEPRPPWGAGLVPLFFIVEKTHRGRSCICMMFS